MRLFELTNDSDGQRKLVGIERLKQVQLFMT